MEMSFFRMTKKQNTVAKSSTSAEYIAVSEVNVIIGILKFFQFNITKPIRIYEDNLEALITVQNGNATKNSKHIKVHNHFIHKYYLKGIIDVVRNRTNTNIADIFTKALDKINFVKYRNALSVVL